MYNSFCFNIVYCIKYEVYNSLRYVILYNYQFEINYINCDFGCVFVFVLIICRYSECIVVMLVLVYSFLQLDLIRFRVYIECIYIFICDIIFYLISIVGVWIRSLIIVEGEVRDVFYYRYGDYLI